MAIIPEGYFSTYSIIARDPETGQFGVAVQTHQMSVGAAVPWLEPGIGAVATQAMTNISFGPRGLALLSKNMPAPEVLRVLIESDKDANLRQVAIIDGEGNVATWTGENCIPVANHHNGDGYSVQANMMTNATVIPAMITSFEAGKGDFAQRLLDALMAAENEGGDIRGMQSASIKIVPGARLGEDSAAEQRSLYDLRVDEHVDPLEELIRLVRLQRAQLLDMEGHEDLEENEIRSAMQKWEEARTMAPELEEMGFWQAVALVDKTDELQLAAKIFASMPIGVERQTFWIDLIGRLELCGLIETSGAGEKLISVIKNGEFNN
ncbi:MAG: DUF1028 domain-containing protein [Chloroflexi bacterium]|nr:DUF1028 domain-containing protein [Chloroflexota bacterium]